eukprot:TRINITY_DN13758_c0_g1_i1.p2 TRINITY_DN13758_c0_g1~~TRINITY_DN13758_c0_g1_i1.p2  ORF type:complete len:277 (+),score=92.59 TRINITY_DN13758_c0_g1_i1:126-956(+)
MPSVQYRYAPEVNERVSLMKCLGLDVAAWCRDVLGPSGAAAEVLVEEDEVRIATEHEEGVAWEAILRGGERGRRGAVARGEVQEAHAVLHGIVAAEEAMHFDYTLARTAAGLAEAARREGVAADEAASFRVIAAQYAVGNAMLDLVETEAVSRLRILRTSLGVKHSAFKALKAADPTAVTKARVQALLAAPTPCAPPEREDGQEAVETDAAPPPAAGPPEAVPPAAAADLWHEVNLQRAAAAQEERAARRALVRAAVAALEAVSAGWFARAHAEAR